MRGPTLPLLSLCPTEHAPSLLPSTSPVSGSKICMLKANQPTQSRSILTQCIPLTSTLLQSWRESGLLSLHIFSLCWTCFNVYTCDGSIVLGNRWRLTEQKFPSLILKKKGKLYEYDTYGLGHSLFFFGNQESSSPRSVLSGIRRRWFFCWSFHLKEK